MENQALWSLYKQQPSSSIKKKIIVNYINLVHYVIHNSRFMQLAVVEEKDFFQFGIEGLSEAIDRFNPEYGTKFETYAIQRIRGKIIDELRKLQIRPRAKEGTDEQQWRNISLDNNINDEDSMSLYEVLPSDAETPDEIMSKSQQKDQLMALIKKLPERERLVITLYYYEELNYKSIAEVLNITVSRVSQIHSKIISQLRTSLLVNA